MRLLNVAAGWLIALTAGAASMAAVAADVQVQVETSAGVPIPDAVVYAVPAAAIAHDGVPKATIDQINRQFVPRVSVVQTGTAVDFPNSDNIRHSVYSFSPAKIFTLKLYAGRPADPIVFDKAGLVVLGCNIHDRMVAWLLVVDTPYYTRTDRNGVATLSKLPAGEYSLRAWHAPMSEDQQVAEPLRVASGAAVPPRTLRISVDVDMPDMPH